MLVTAAKCLCSDLLLVQEREFLMELEVYIISDVYLVVKLKEAYFSPLTLQGFLLFFSVVDRGVQCN